MMEEYIQLLDMADSCVYVCDRESLELLYANQPALDFWGRKEDYHGQICHRYINGMEEPCPWCSIPRLKDGRLRVDESYSEAQDRWFRIDCRALDWFGRKAVAVFAFDITHEKKIIAKEQQSRIMYESAVDTARLTVWEFDIQRSRLTISDNPFTQEDFKKFGLDTVIENVPESILYVVEDRDRESYLAMYQAIRDGVPRITRDIWCKARPGQEPRCMRITYTNVFDDNGRPVRAFGIGQNITQEKIEAEKYHRLYRNIIDDNPNSIGVFRLNLTKNWCGDGKSPYPMVMRLQEEGTADSFFEKMTRMVAYDWIREEYGNLFTRKNMLEAFRQGKTQFAMEFPVATSDGKLVWGAGFLNMAQNPETGEVEGVGYTLDITERRKNEEIIHRMTDEKYDYIGLLDPVSHTFEFRNVSKDESGPVLDQKRDSDQYLEQSMKRDVDPEDRDRVVRCAALDHLQEVLQTEKTYVIPYTSTKEGRVHYKQIHYSWLDEGRREILVMQLDVTATREQEADQLKRMEAAVAEAERANKAKSEFLSRISHDIRTPMNVITSMTRFAIEDMDDHGKLFEDLQEIRNANLFLMSLINDILDISKIDSGKIELHPEPYPPEEFFPNIRGMFEPLCADKGLRLVVDDSRAKDVIITDRIRFNQIALNLMSNAVKYTPSGGTVTYRGAVEPRPDGRADCLIEVMDTGIGMSGEFQQKMFEPFTQEKPSGTATTSEFGTGLGLSIVRRIVDLMDGTISVKSVPGKGTDIAVRFVFPLAAPGEPAGTKTGGRAEAAPSAGGDEGNKPFALKGGTVLLVEDHAMNASIATRVLESFGARVVRAENGARGVERFEGSQPGEFDVILMDIQMPVMDGYAATRTIRALSRPDAAEIPIIAMTADAYAEDVERCLKAGMNAHLAKPLNPEDLRRTLAGWMGRPSGADLDAAPGEVSAHKKK